jgi:hypothetical protein
VAQVMRSRFLGSGRGAVGIGAASGSDQRAQQCLCESGEVAAISQISQMSLFGSKEFPTGLFITCPLYVRSI